jgi:hypothetical protein
MIYGYLPFEDPDNEILFQKILECKPDMPGGVSASAVDLMNRIMVTNPDKRITIDKIKEHSFYLKGKKIFNDKHPQLNDKAVLNAFNQNNSAKLLKKKELNLNLNVFNVNDNNKEQQQQHRKERESLQTPTSSVKYNNIRTETIKHNSNNNNHSVNNNTNTTTTATTTTTNNKDKPNPNFFKSTLTPKNNGIIDFRASSRKEHITQHTTTSPILLRHDLNFLNSTNTTTTTTNPTKKDFQYIYNTNNHNHNSNNSIKKSTRINTQQHQLSDSKKNYTRANTVSLRSENRLTTEHDILDRNFLLSSSPQNYFRKTSNIQTDINIPSSSTSNPANIRNTINHNTSNNSTNANYYTHNTNNLSKRILTSIQRTDLNSYRRSMGHQHYQHQQMQKRLLVV